MISTRIVRFALALVAACLLLAAGTKAEHDAHAAGIALIWAVNTNTGPMSGGTYNDPDGYVTITGSNLGDVTDVKFGGTSSPWIQRMSDSEVRAVPPPHSSAEGVTVSVGGPFLTSLQQCLLPLPCVNAYFYTQAIPFSFSDGGTLLGPLSKSAFGADISLTVNGSYSVQGTVHMARNLGVPDAMIIDATVNAHSVTPQLTISGELNGSINLPYPLPSSIPEIVSLEFRLSAGLGTHVTFSGTLHDFSIRTRGGFVNGLPLLPSVSLSCAGTAITFSNLGSLSPCWTFNAPSGSVDFSAQVAPLWLQVGPDLIYAGAGPKFAVNASVNTLLEYYIEVCGSVPWEIHAGFEAFDVGFTYDNSGYFVGAFNIYSVPDTTETRSHCPYGTPRGGSNGTGGGGGGGGTPPPEPPAPTDNTPPIISVSVTPGANDAGWNRTPVSVNWTVSDPESGIAATNGCTDSLIYETNGTVRSCSATNGDGLSSSGFTRLIRVDQTSPLILGSRDPPANGYGWNNTDVTVHFQCTETGAVRSGVRSCTADQVLTAEGRNQSRSGTAVDYADNSASTTVSGISIDKTAPTTTHALEPAAPNGKRGWYISDVTVTLNASDPLLTSGEEGSGIQHTKYRVNGGSWLDYTVPFVVSTESLDNVVEYYSVDKADNTETTHEFHFKLDKTKPEIGITSGETDDITWDRAHLERGILANDANLATAGDATDNLCLWEVRAVDRDSGQTLASQAPENAGVYPPPPPTSLAYDLDVPLHTGINTIDFVAEDCAGWEKSIGVQVVYVIPGPHDPRSKGFWYTALATRHYTTPQVLKFISYTNVASDVWGNDATRNRFGPLTLVGYRSILGVPDNAQMEQKMQAQLLADWLNMVSGRLAVKKAVDVSPVKRWDLVMDDIGGNPLTYAYRVTLEIEEKVQPAPAGQQINLVSKNLAEGLNLNALIVP